MIADDATQAEPVLTAAPPMPRKLAPGSRFADRYEVESLLGEGGMGAVYRVHDHVLAEIVALKVLALPMGGTRDHAEMFRQEVKLSRRITHANVIHVYDIGAADSLLYMTMELVEGITLRRAIYNAGGKLPFGEAIRVAHALANGLAAVHAQGIIHRDLKPGNVMIAKSGRVVLADFGIASQFGTDDPAARGRIIGTVSYMAPEQFAKQAPTPRTDLYSFGLVFLEALIGALPPRCEGWLSSHRRPIVVDLVAAGVAGKTAEIAAVENLLRRCLENDPAARPASAEEVSRELNALLVHETSHVDIGVHAVDRAHTGAALRVHMPVPQAAEALVDRTTMEVADIVAQGIPDDVAQDYVKARHESRLNSGMHIVSAYERFDNCVHRAPQFLRAIASRAILSVRCWFVESGLTSDVDWEEIASECVDVALRRAPELSDSHLAMAMLATQRFEMKQTTRALIRALELDPTSHEAQEYLGGIEIETGLVDRGIPRVMYGASAFPQRPIPCIVLARCHALLQQFDQAEAEIAEAFRRSSIPTLGGLMNSLRVHAYRWGKKPTNLTIAQRKIVREQNWIVVTHYVEALAGTADAQGIAGWIDGYVNQLRNRRARMVLRQVYAEIFMLLGLEYKALELLADCARGGLIDIIWIDRCPLFAPLRSVEGFARIRDWVWLNAYGVWN
ncbi:MAG TPA: serine/threonine-protein kinase [Polyangium sp.]|nr:serine/threonine-protein kinase [Polyangium sp.]